MKRLLRGALALLLVVGSVAVATPSVMAFNSKPVGVAYSDPNLTSLGLNGVLITSTGTELNLIHDQINSVSTAATASTGYSTAHFTFKNAAGSTVTGIRGLTCYASDSAGGISAPTATMSVATYGTLVQLVQGKVALGQVSSAGKLGITFTSSATGSFYISFVLPNGKIVTSSVLTVN